MTSPTSDGCSDDPRPNHDAVEKPRRPAHAGSGVRASSLHYEASFGVLKRG